MTIRLPSPGGVVAVALFVALAGCSTAGKGSPSGESAAASPPAPEQPRRVRPESLKTDPSMQQELPIVAATPADTGGPRATIARLEREARAIAKSDGCHSVAACRSAPVGAKACGGPRTYLVYCAATTDTLALMRKLRELERVEKAYNETSGMMSTCEMRLAPVTELVGTTCREASGGGQVR